MRVEAASLIGQQRREFRIEFYLMGSHLNLTDRQEKFLAVMGVQVWHERAALHRDPVSQSQSLGRSQGQSQGIGNLADAVVPVSEPVATKRMNTTPPPDTKTEASEAAVGVTPIEFLWWRGTAGMLFGDVTGNYDERLLKDLVAALDWQFGSTRGNVTNGHFRWPQLTTTSGSPERAMRAFLDKYLPEGANWLIVAESLSVDLSPFFPIDLKCWHLPESMRSPNEKRALWQRLAK